MSMPGRPRFHVQRTARGSYEVIAAPPRVLAALKPTHSCPDVGTSTRPLAAATWSGHFRSFDQARLRQAFEANLLHPFGARWKHFFYLGAVECTGDRCKRGHARKSCQGMEDQSAESTKHTACTETVPDEVVAASLFSICNVEEAFYGDLPLAGDPGYRQMCPGVQATWPQYFRTSVAFRAARAYELRAAVAFDWFLRLRTDTLMVQPSPPHHAFRPGVTVPIAGTAHMNDQFAGAPPRSSNRSLKWHARPLPITYVQASSEEGA
jgi:hypothetical protein